MTEMQTNARSQNSEKLYNIRGLKDDWNGNGAPAISVELIDKTEKILENLKIQPEVFPTALGTIQMEFDNQHGDHMEVEIGLSDASEVFVQYLDGKDYYDSVPTTADAINEIVSSFY